MDAGGNVQPGLNIPPWPASPSMTMVQLLVTLRPGPTSSIVAIVDRVADGFKGKTAERRRTLPLDGLWSQATNWLETGILETSDKLDAVLPSTDDNGDVGQAGKSRKVVAYVREENLPQYTAPCFVTV
jgi:hypothetical protein